MNNPSLYRNPSTFTYIGRHASELKFLLSRAKNRSEILEIGPGPFEPFYIAALSPASKITVVDVDQKILSMIQSVRDKVLISLKDVADHCCNINDDGSKRKNRDLLDPRMVENGANELRLAGLLPSDYLWQNNTLFGFQKNADMALIESDIQKYQPFKQFDIIFEGLVLLNLRKVLNDQEFVATLCNIAGLARTNAVVGIGTTPAGISGPKEYLSMLMKIFAEKKLYLQELIVDNLVNAEGGLRGGYLATFSNKRWSSEDFQLVESYFRAEQSLAKAKIIAPYVPAQKMLELLQDKELILLAAVHAGGDYYGTLFAFSDSFDIPKVRNQFTVMGRL